MQAWFYHNPLVEHVLYFLPPSDVFVECRGVTKLWHNIINSSSYCEFYYRHVVCRVNVGESIFTFDETWIFPEEPKMVVSNVEEGGFFDFSFSDVEEEEEALIPYSIVDVLQKMELLVSKSHIPSSITWKKDCFYLKLLTIIGFVGKKKQIQNCQILAVLHEVIIGDFVGKLKEYLTRWKLLNFAREEVILALCVKDEQIIIRDDGKPFVFSGERINNVCVYSAPRHRSSLAGNIHLTPINNFIFGDGQPCMLTQKDKAVLWKLFILVSEKARQDVARLHIKKPKTGYILFATEKRKNIEENNPEMEVVSAVKMVACMWREASDEEKQIYVGRALEERTIHKRNLTSWRPVFKELDDYEESESSSSDSD